MLSALEGRIAAVVSEAAAAGLSVIRPPAGFSGLQAGNRAVRIALAELGPGARSFNRETFSLLGSTESPAARRFVVLLLLARMEFLALPEDPQEPAPARRLLLEDISRIAHRLGAAEARDGTLFQSAAADPGFTVEAFELERGEVGDGTVEGAMRGELRYRVTTRIWPPGEPESLGRIDAVDPFIAGQPVDMRVARSVVAPGQTTEITIHGLGGRRLTQVDAGTRAPLQLAVSVASDLPLAERGSVVSGDTGAEDGVRLIAAAGPDTVLSYRAPADPGATRVEFVVVHLATPERRRGLVLGSVAIRLRPEAP